MWNCILFQPNIFPVYASLSRAALRRLACSTTIACIPVGALRMGCQSLKTWIVQEVQVILKCLPLNSLLFERESHLTIIFELAIFVKFRLFNLHRYFKKSGIINLQILSELLAIKTIVFWVWNTYMYIHIYIYK